MAYRYPTHVCRVPICHVNYGFSFFFYFIYLFFSKFTYNPTQYPKMPICQFLVFLQVNHLHYFNQVKYKCIRYAHSKFILSFDNHALHFHLFFNILKNLYFMKTMVFILLLFFFIFMV